MADARGGFGTVVRARWQALQPRERRLVGGGLAVVGVALFWTVLVDPAVKGRARLERELPALRAQVAQLDALAAEAKRMQGPAGGRLTPEAVREELRRSAASAGLGEGLSMPGGEGGRIELRFADVPHAAWLRWMDGAQRSLRLQPQQVTLTRRDTARVDAVVVFAMPKGEGA